MNAIRQAISVNLFVSLSDRSGSDPYIHMETAAVTPLPRRRRHPVADTKYLLKFNKLSPIDNISPIQVEKNG